MTNEDVKALIAQGYQLEQTNKHALSELINIVEKSISAIANLNPQLAFDVLQNLAEEYTQEEVDEILEERETQRTEFIEALNISVEDE